MAPPHKRNSLAATRTRGQEDLAVVWQLVDRHGHLHSEGVYKNWSPAAIKALGIERRCHALDRMVGTRNRFLPLSLRGRV